MRFALILLGPGILSAQLSFEVASVRPAPPGEMNRISVQMSTDEGRLSYNNPSLSDLIAIAYSVQHRQISGPDWINDRRFDIEAKYPAGAKESQVPEMLRSLLAERFGLRLHEEAKEMSIYSIEIGKSGPKMKKAETSGNFSANRTKALSHIVATTTLENLADNLSGQLDRPVVNKSGLEGAWTIDLQWLNDAGTAPVDDATAPSIFTAMQEQLGLKLTPTRGPVRILVIDRCEKSPTDN